MNCLVLKGYEYDEIERVVENFFEDLELNNFPADIFVILKMLDIEVVRYSELKNSDREFCYSKVKDGYSTYYKECTYHIYVNDYIFSEARIIYTLWYELGHIQLNHFEKDCKKSQAQMRAEANHFANYAQAPVSFLNYKKVQSIEDVIKYCGVSPECAKYAFTRYCKLKNNYPVILEKALSQSRLLEIFDLENKEAI